LAQNPDDAIAASPRITAAQVVDYLKRHPNFLQHHPELLDSQTPPARAQGEGVVDLQQFMVDRLRRDLTGCAACRTSWSPTAGTISRPRTASTRRSWRCSMPKPSSI
jgi:Uncharacterized protein conserved in bacteria